MVESVTFVAIADPCEGDAYDLYGRPRIVEVTGQGKTEYEYSSDHRTRTIIRTVAQGGARLITKEITDGFGRLVRRENPDGTAMEFFFDEYGRSTGSRLIASNGKQQTSTQTLYDVLDRPVSITTAGGAKETFEYAVDGDLTVVTRKQSITGNGNVQHVESKEYRNALGQVVKTVSPDGCVTEMNYDGFGNLKSSRLTPVGGGEVQIRSFVYDSQNRLVRKTDPETGTIKYSNFNDQRKPQTITEASGRKRTLVYDSLGRLSKVRSADQKEGFDYKYAGLDLVAATTFNPDGAVSRTYEYKGPGGQLSLETLTQKDSRATMEYGYDAYGALTSMTYPSGRKISYVHDALGRVKGVGLDGKPVLSRVQFDEWGSRKEMQFSSGAFDRWEFDELGLRLKTWTVGHGGQAFEDGVRHYTYDSAERLTGAGEWSLLHNVMGQLTQANFNPLNQKNAAISTFHTYDGYGNQASHLAMGAGATGMINYDLNPMADNKVSGLAKNNAATGWKYNADGEATNIGVAVGSSQSFNLVWDGLGRLSSVAGPGTHQHYTYDANGMRVALKDSAAPGNNRRFFYGAGGLLIGEYGISKRNVGSREVIYLGSEPIAEVDEKGIYELHKDHLGTPRLITSGSTGKIEGRQAYGAYGEFLPDASPDSTYKSLIGYTGHIQTDATGLIYMRGRYYSPAWHRFVNSDQGVDPNSPNQFAYCIGSPMMAVDPSGMEWWNPFTWFSDSDDDDDISGYATHYGATVFYPGGATVEVICDLPEDEDDWGEWEDYWEDNTGNTSQAKSYSSGGIGALQQTNKLKQECIQNAIAYGNAEAGRLNAEFKSNYGLSVSGAFFKEAGDSFGGAIGFFTGAGLATAGQISSSYTSAFQAASKSTAIPSGWPGAVMGLGKVASSVGWSILAGQAVAGISGAYYYNQERNSAASILRSELYLLNRDVQKRIKKCEQSR